MNLSREGQRLADALGHANRVFLLRRLHEQQGKLLVEMEAVAKAEVERARDAVFEAEATHMNPHPGLAVQS